MRAVLLRALTVVVLALAAYGAVVSLVAAVPRLGDLARSASTPVAAMVAGDEQAAVRLAIEHSNQAQARAFNTNDDTVMRAQATDAFYERLVQTNHDMHASGVSEIALVSTEYRDVTVSGIKATATTLETWRSAYADGSTDESTARNDYALVREGTTWKVASDDQPAATGRPVAQQPSTDVVTPAAARTSSTSSNWSGYAATGGSFTSVTGAWTVPSVSATTAGADATWVGIGGVESHDLIQAGTQAIVDGGTVAYVAWIELLPASSREVHLAVNAGDSVTVTIAKRTGDQWSIAMKNDTTGEGYATTVTYRSALSSAEWVEEAPSVGRGTVALDEFGTVAFTSARAVRDGSALGLGALGARPITMINDARQALARPSTIGAGGASFSVTRTSAQSLPPTPGRPRRGG